MIETDKPPNHPKTAILAAIRPFGILRSRLPLIEYLTQAGWRVVVATVEDHLAKELRDAGVILEHVPFKRGGLSPLSDFRAITRMNQLYQKYQPQIIHLFHAKPILLGSMSAFVFRSAKIIITITGLGHGISGNRLAATLYEYALRTCFKRADKVIFQNRDDYKRFISKNIVPDHKSRLILGSGVDLEVFRPRRNQTKDNSQVTVCMASRLHWRKGVQEYLEAANSIKQSGLPVKFQLAGEWDDHHPDAIDRQWLMEKSNPWIEFLGYVTNMSEHLQNVDILVHPSYYREGVPRILLEASACGIPIITTDVPGCREALQDGVTGFLVPPQDSRALAAAILNLASNSSLRQQMGKRGRAFVEEQFDIHKITQQTIRVYQELGFPG